MRPARRARVQQDIRVALTNESYHVFNLGEEDGFVIISGDDCTDDILGYADSGTFDAEDMPENLRAWLQGYAEQIAWMKANNVTNESSPQGGRDNSARKVRAKIAPLLTSKWDQDDPYNRQTPLNGSQHCVTGCVATAMAQVMYYWYKKEGYEAKLENDIPDYIDDGSYRANLKSPETFDWANMLDEYHILNEETNEEELIGTQTEHDAVAKLMKYVGYSVKMNYDLAAQGGSGAQPQNIAPALTDYFGYKSARHVGACQYSYEDLQTVIYSDLAAGRPVLYGGRALDGAHRFVCDGYDEDDYFHFNWGWGGSSDGYYKLVLCDPKEQGIGGSSTGYTFYMEQNAVCGIHPTQTISLPIEPLECASEEDISMTDIDIPDLYRGETADIKVTLKNNNETTAFNGNVKLRLNGRIDATIVNIPPNSIKECTVTATIPYIWSGTLYVYVYDIITDNNHTEIGERVVRVYGALPNLNGTAEIKDNYAEVGKALSYQLSGDVASLSASDIHPRWQVSKNGEDRWEDIAGATGTTYTPKGSDLGKHIRVIVKADGYHGELVSDAREVLNVLKGMVEFSNNSKSPGDNLACNITGEAAAIDASSIQRQWQRSSDGQSGWAYIATGPYYNLKASDVGYYFRMRVFAEGYYGSLYSPSRKCVKWECVKPVVAPMLEISTAYNQVQVTNPQVGQEYIILDYKKALYNLTESDWANAKSFNEGDNFLFMGGTAGKTNYVYTRVKETGTALAGTDVRMEAIYFGENVYVQDIVLDVARVENPNSWYSNYVALEQDDLGAYYMKCGETYRITVKSLPQNATNFSGVQGSKWLVKGYSRASQWGRYYSDKECTTIIDANTYYKTVYFKPQDGMPVNYMELRAEFTKGYNDVATDAILVNVASNNGMYKVEQIYTERVSLNRGEIVVIRPFGTRPSKAVPSTVSATLTSGEGTAPIVAFIPSEKSYMVNAINATKGTFFYAVYADGTAVSTMTVDVKTHELEEMVVLPSEFTLEGTDQEGTPQGRRRSAEADGESLQLTALQFPFGADEAITWRSSNPSVATVSSDGTVTVKSGADIGETVTITATAGGYTSSSKLTVAGEKYPLYIAGIQVTSRNRYDLGAEVAKVSEASRRQYETGEMDITFNGDVLRLKNAVINTGNSNAPGIVLGKYGTTVVVEGDCSISSTSGVGMKVAKTANIVGDGSLTIISSDAAVLLDSEDGSGNDYIRLVASDLELLSLMGTNQAIKGSEGNLCSVELNNVTAWGQGNSSVISGLSGGLGLEGCYFQEPKGAEMRDGSLWDGSTLADYFYIERGEDPDGIKDLKDFRDFKDFKDSWFTIDGRKLSGKPSKAGLYIFGNRKVVIK